MYCFIINDCQEKEAKKESCREMSAKGQNRPSLRERVDGISKYIPPIECGARKLNVRSVYGYRRSEKQSKYAR